MKHSRITYVVLVEKGDEVESVDGITYLRRHEAEAACQEARADGTEAFVYEVRPV